MKRNHYQNKSEKVFYQRISNETFPAKRLERGITPGKRNRPKKTEDMKTCLPNSLWRQCLYQNFSEERSIPNKFQQKPLPKRYWKKHFYQKPSEGISLQHNFKRNTYQKGLKKQYLRKISEEKLWNICKQNSTQIYTSAEKFSTKQSAKGNSWIENSSNTLQKKPLPKNIWKACPPRMFWRRISTKKTSEKNLTSENLSKKICPKKISKIDVYPKIMKRHSLPKNVRNISIKSLKRLFNGKATEEQFQPKNLWREIPTKNSRNISTQKIEKIHEKQPRKNPNW